VQLELQEPLVQLDLRVSKEMWVIQVQLVLQGQPELQVQLGLLAQPEQQEQQDLLEQVAVSQETLLEMCCMIQLEIEVLPMLIP
jgi:hypothetical protein